MTRGSLAPTLVVTTKYDGWIVAGLCALLVMVVTALAGLWRYKSIPGLVGEAQALWPATSGIARNGEEPTLLMFAHPKCPCTVASLSELRELMSDFEGGVDALVVFLRPSDVDDEWTKSWISSLAASIPGIRVVEDIDGQEARRFGARTSGHVLLYSTEGNLLFSGGITGSRGHVGENAGLDRVTSRLEKTSVSRACSEVFGCPLRDPESERDQP